MFVGHGLLAFALAALLAQWWGADRDRALSLGLLAGAFATLPDVDIVHPLIAVVLQPVDVFSVPAAFWAASTEIHRAVTHSLVVGVAIAIGVTGLTLRATPPHALTKRVARPLGVALLTGLLWTVHTVSGPLATAVVGLVVVGALLLAWLAVRFGIGPRPLLAVALLGLLSHPFGDLFTGQPPPLLYPSGVKLVGARITLHADPTLHLLGAFLVELATVWFAVGVVARLFGWPVRPQVHRRAGLGAGYGVAAVAFPAPTLNAASTFVFTVLGVGLLGTPVRLGGPGPRAWQALLTALAAVTLGTVAFGAVYVVL